MPTPRKLGTFLGLLLLLGVSIGNARAWWNGDWTIRKKITVDTTAQGGAITTPIGTSTVLVRLHDGNFDFSAAKDDGSDIRFVSADDKTLLPYHIEKYDSLMNEAFVWVKVPDIKPGAATNFWLYYGNQGDKAVPVNDPKGSYDGDTLLVYHFAQKAAPTDSTGNANDAKDAPIPTDGSMIGGGARFDGQKTVTIPASSSLAWNDRDALTWSAWIKPTVLAPDAILFSRHDGANGFVIGLANGVPYVQVTDGAGTHRSPGGTPLAAGAWKHLAAVADDAKITLYVDGKSYATLNTPLPGLKGNLVLGGDANGGPGYAGELDELEISRVARPAGFVQLTSTSQGGTAAADKLLVEAQDETASGGMFGWLSGGLGLMGVLLKSVTIDGWVVIGILAIMAVVTWVVMVTKFFYLLKVEKGTAEFLEEWHEVAADLTKIDKEDTSVKKVGVPEDDDDDLDALHASPIYKVYHIGSEEINHRLNAGKKGIDPRALQAIRASLDGGWARENQKLNSHMVFLTIAIAGGPFMGLLGTVIGVMITFAEIAASGEVNINAIAPGIAAALIATVAGLAVAIPALFGYNYLVSKIKEVALTVQVFIDEFITKMAEFYPVD